MNYLEQLLEKDAKWDARCAAIIQAQRSKAQERAPTQPQTNQQTRHDLFLQGFDNPYHNHKTKGEF